MQKKYLVRLTAEDRTELEAMVKKGKAAAYKIKHANILLAADVKGPAWPDQQIAEAFSCHLRTVENVRRRLVLEGSAAALERKPQAQPSHPPRLDGKGEARLIALACVFLFTEALQGWREVSVRPQRTAVDWAQEVAVLLESCVDQTGVMRRKRAGWPPKSENRSEGQIHTGHESLRRRTVPGPCEGMLASRYERSCPRHNLVSYTHL